MKAEFTVIGDPTAKGRARFARRGKYVQTYTPDKTANYETLVRLEYERQCEGIVFAPDIPLEMKVKAYLRVPKSTSKKKQLQMLNGKLRPIKKPDSTNICKAVEDALNKIAYSDDTQFVETTISRFYGDPARIEVLIREVITAEDLNQEEFASHRGLE